MLMKTEMVPKITFVESLDTFLPNGCFSIYKSLLFSLHMPDGFASLGGFLLQTPWFSKGSNKVHSGLSQLTWNNSHFKMKKSE